MRKALLSLFVAALLMSAAAGYAEGPVMIPIVSMEVKALDDPTPSPTPTQAPTHAPTPTAAPTPSPVPTPTPTPTLEPTPEATETPTPTPEPTPVPTMGTLMSDSQPTTMAVGGIFSGGSTVLGSSLPRASITSIRFDSSIESAPADAWDVSADRNGSVLAWVTDGALTIASEGGVRANADSSYLFAGYSSVTTIDFNGSFYTESAANMSHMFESCWGIASLDLSSLDTSNVTDMSYMFGFCSELSELNLTGFNTIRVANMEGMFFMDTKLGELDVSSFNTTAVTSMRSMFESCTALQSLDLSVFNTASVSDMRWMFSGCEVLTKISVPPSFGSSGNASEMFSGCPAAMTIVEGAVNDEVATNDGAAVEITAEQWSEYESYNSFKLWTRGDDVRKLQSRLNELGYNVGYVDGTYGPNTQKALSKWQSDHGYTASGFPEAAQMRELFG